MYTATPKKLLTCPFCGSSDVVDVIHWVECKTCGGKGPTIFGHEWNERALFTKDSGKQSYVYKPLDVPKCGITGW